MFGCKYINFSRSTSELELIARRMVNKEEGQEVERAVLDDYADPDSERYDRMVENIRRQLGFTSLRFNRLDDMLDSCGIDRTRLCTYCWNGRED
jgi:amidophosphoribosyltransferase